VATFFVNESLRAQVDLVDAIATRWIRGTEEAGEVGDLGWVARRERCRLAPELTSPAQARRFVRTVLSDWRRDDLVKVATLCASELVTNGVLHAQEGPVDLVLGTGASDEGEVHLRVIDRGVDRLPVGRRPTLQSRGGRGLRIIEACTSRWGVTVGSTEKHVWCELGSSVRTEEPQRVEPPQRVATEGNALR
jgi:anti-sigma regulatory factor (Ser/Thr protein kinase)